MKFSDEKKKILGGFINKTEKLPSQSQDAKQGCACQRYVRSCKRNSARYCIIVRWQSSINAAPIQGQCSSNAAPKQCQCSAKSGS